MKKELFYTIALIIPILLLLSFPAWSVPGLINYQGKLTDPNGISLNGFYIMKFYLYNVESGGSHLWNEQQEVTVTNGIYNVELGEGSSFSSDLFDNENLFLEAEIFSTGIGWETLSPRQPLTSTPFAMKAGYATTAGNTDMVDGFQGNDLEESAEINNKIAIHVQDSSSHHPKTTSFTELTDMATDEQIPDDVTVNHAATAGDAEKLDGKDSSEFGDGYSLDAADGSSTDIVYVDNAGNVGIGTTTPSEKLHIKGTATWGSAVKVTDTNNNVETVIRSMGEYELGAIGTASNHDLHLSTNGIAKMIIKTDGNVGIGTTSPKVKLHLTPTNWNAPVGNHEDLAIESHNAGIGLYSLKETIASSNLKLVEVEADGSIVDVWTMGRYANDNPQGTDYSGSFHIKYGNTTSYWEHPSYFSILKTGNVGIGTMRPAFKLHVSGGDIAHTRASEEGPRLRLINPDKPGLGREWIMYNMTGAYGNSLQFWNYGGDGWGNKFTITDSGNVGIGTSNPKGKLDVNGSIFQRGSQLHADYVFEPDYKLESIEEHAKFMWKEKHLKAISKAKVDENGKEIVEIGSHQRGIVEELEKAHIYIEQLHNRNTELKKRLVKLEEKLAELEGSKINQ